MKQEDELKKGTPLLDRYIQRKTMDKMKQFDEKALAEAIKSILLMDNENPKNLN